MTRYQQCPAGSYLVESVSGHCGQCWHSDVVGVNLRLLSLKESRRPGQENCIGRKRRRSLLLHRVKKLLVHLLPQQPPAVAGLYIEVQCVDLSLPQKAHDVRDSREEEQVHGLLLVAGEFPGRFQALRKQPH